MSARNYITLLVLWFLLAGCGGGNEKPVTNSSADAPSTTRRETNASDSLAAGNRDSDTSPAETGRINQGFQFDAAKFAEQTDSEAASDSDTATESFSEDSPNRRPQDDAVQADPGDSGVLRSDPGADSRLDSSTTADSKSAAAMDAPDFELTSQAFDAEFSADVEAAIKKYGDKVVELTGPVIGLGRTVYDYVLDLQGEEFGFVQCFTQIREPWTIAAPGQTVTLRGIYRGARLHNCKIVKVEGDPPSRMTADELAAEFAKDPQATREKYDDKWLIVTGEIKSLHPGDYDVMELELKNAVGPHARVLCKFMVDSVDVTKKFTVGQQLTSIGEYYADGEDNETGIWLCEAITPQPPLPPSREIDVRLDTPENALETYKNARAYRDWKTMLRCLDKKSAYRELLSFAGSTRDWSGELLPPEEIAEKYQVDWKDWGAPLTGPEHMETLLKNVPDHAEFYADLMAWLATQADNQRYDKYYDYQYNRQPAAWKTAKVREWKKNGDFAAVAIVDLPNQQDAAAPNPTAVVFYNHDQRWLIDTWDSHVAALEYKQENVPVNDELVAKLELADDEPGYLALSPDGKMIVFTTATNHAVAWNFQNNKTLWKVENPVFEGVYGKMSLTATTIALSPDGNKVAVGFTDGGFAKKDTPPLLPIVVFDVHSGQQIGKLPGHSALVHRIGFTKDSNQLVSLGKDAYCRVWDLNEMKEVRSFVFNSDRDQTALPIDNAEHVALSQDCSVLLVDSGDKLTVINIETGKVQCQIPSQPFVAFAVSSNGSFCIAVHRGGGVLSKWDCQSGQKLDSWKTELPQYSDRIAISPDSRLLAVRLEDWKAGVIDSNTGETIQVLSGHKNLVANFTFSPDSKLLATTASEICVWRVDDE